MTLPRTLRWIDPSGREIVRNPIDGPFDRWGNAVMPPAEVYNPRTGRMVPFVRDMEHIGMLRGPLIGERG